MALKKGDTLLMTGDSVTDCGRSKEGRSAPGSSEGMGGGYAMLVKAYLDAFHPELDLKVINKGISGNRTCDILDRMERDHLDLSPDVVTLLIGINDVWRHFDSPSIPQISPEQYYENMQMIICRFKEKAREVYVLPPFLIKHADESGMYKMAKEYEKLAIEAAEKAGAKVINIWPVFDSLIKDSDPVRYSPDTVHPSISGHMVIAKELLKVLK